MKWTEEETLKFAKLYHEKECLWNPGCPSYKDKIIRQKAIESVVHEMKEEGSFAMRFGGFGAPDVKQKIKNLRSTYNQELIKIKKSRTDELYTPSLKWFFIMDVIMKQTKGAVEFQNADNSDWTDELFGTDGSGDIQLNSYLPYEQYTQILVADQEYKQLLPQQSAVPTKSKTFSGQRKSRAQKRKLQDLLFAVKELRAANEAFSAVKQDLSENEAFGCYVAKSLDRLNPCEAIMCQQEIHSVITKYRLGQGQVFLESEVE